MERVKAWRLAEAVGRARPGWFGSWLEWGLIPPAGPDDQWHPEVFEQIAHAKALRAEARSLPRRALLLHRDGYPVEAAVRRRAVAEVLRVMARPGHKMGQVIWETRALDPRYRRPTRRQPLPRLELTPDRWPAVPEASSDEAFNRWYQAAAYVVGALRSVGSAKGVPVAEDLPYEERLALAMVIQLLEESEVREALGLAPKPPRHALAIQG